ncbi:hypothetical protein B0O80DRAFT_529018 [Mortierella sp. GBAus27b]|nr:hypothetical protein BGX31_000285 [Mortierella sp. GBA43]KAI8354214.1 hypothetical protein B0O80DRAFT_529018 [Mortierella sp. GBAus27b]
MHIEESSLADLKAYLTKELTLISDADPAMLADYIIALLKHDKGSSELKELCVTQLEDFLQKDTESFVNTMFRALESKSYIQDPKPAAESSPPPYTASADASSSNYENNDYDDIPTGPAAERDRQYDSSASRGRGEKHHRGDSDASDDEDRSYKHARRDDDRDGNRRRRDYSPSRPSDDDRYNGRNRRTEGYGQSNGHLDHDRRGDRSTRQPGSSNTGHGNRNNANDGNGPDRGHWNNSQQNRGNYEGGSRGNYQDHRGDGGSWRGGSNMRGGRGGMHGSPGFGQDRPKRQRCRDYDEKGFCMRGDMCPYDHGEDRIVVDEIGRVPFDMMGAGLGPNGMMGMGANGPPFFPGGPNGGMMPNPSEIYDPEAAALAMNEMGPPRGGNRQGGHDGGRGPMESGGRGGMRGRGALRGMRGGRGRGGGGGGGGSHPYQMPGHFAGAAPGTAGTKTSLVVEHIPDEFNSIDKVNEFFKQFGNLTNIQVDQSAHKALIQYSSRDEASAAYNSPEVIFGNRFVKVYWQPDDLDASTFGRQPKPTGQVRPEKGPGGSHHHHGPPKPPASSVLMTPERAAELATERAAAAAKLQESKKAMQEIQKQREALIQRQQEEQKRLMQKLFANKNMSQEDKDEILKGLKNVAIEVTKEPVDPLAQARANAAAAEAQRQADLQKEAERLEKARLDRELETLNATDPPAQAAGTSTEAADTTAALKAKLAALQAQAAALGVDHQGGYSGRGRGGYIPRGRGRGAPINTWTRGGGRGGAMMSHNRTLKIDNRSSKLTVSNIEEAAHEGLKEHFESFGELESYIFDGTTATVHYRNRKDAEVAMQQGSQVPNATTPLKIGWIPESPAPSVPSATATTALSAAPTGGLSDPASAGAGYESEDEDGERSWKR